MRHVLPELPFPTDALEPWMSKETLEYHHGKHHKAYVDKLNELIVGTEFEKISLEDTVRRSSGEIFNNAAQAWNHEFFWHCMTPRRSSIPPLLTDILERSFGSVEGLFDQFVRKGTEVFGSGWIWIVENQGTLSIETTGNADTPLRRAGTKPVLTCDLWEHAYYIDHRNERRKFLESFTKVISWDFLLGNLSLASRAAA